MSLLLDPYAQNRGGFGQATDFAPERGALPADVASAYASVPKAPPAAAPTFNVWSRGFRRRQPDRRRPGRRKPRHDDARRGIRCRGRLPVVTGHGARLRARRRRHLVVGKLDGELGKGAQTCTGIGQLRDTW